MSSKDFQDNPTYNCTVYREVDTSGAYWRGEVVNRRTGGIVYTSPKYTFEREAKDDCRQWLLERSS